MHWMVVPSTMVLKGLQRNPAMHTGQLEGVTKRVWVYTIGLESEEAVGEVAL